MSETLATRQYCAPSAADGVSLTVTLTVDWVNTTYVTLIASAAADLILTGICPAIVSAPDVHIVEFDVSVGADPNEIPIATFRLYGSASANGQNGQYVPTVIGIDAIPTGSRVSVRARGKNQGFGGPAPVTYRVSITYLQKPLIGTMLTTTQPLLCTPPSPNGVITLMTGVSPWTDGAPVAIRAASGPAMMIVGTSLQGASAGRDYEVDLLADGVVITTLRANQGGQDSYPNYTALHNPLSAIPVDSAVAALARSSHASELARLASVAYFELPL